MGEVLGARNPTTIRELWLRVLDRHTEKFGIPYSANAKPRSLGQCKCGKRWPCPDYVDAVAALDQLNNAPEVEWIAGTRSRVIDDPKTEEQP